MNRTRPEAQSGLAGTPPALLPAAEDRRLPPAGRLGALLDGLRTRVPAQWPPDPVLARGMAAADPGDRAALWGWLLARSMADGWMPLPAETDLVSGLEAEADRLHARLERYTERPALVRRTLERELLLRDRLPEDWAFHRCRWLYRRLQLGPGSSMARSEAAAKARNAGILFHPDQLDDAPARLCRRLRDLLEGLQPGCLLSLTGRLLAGQPCELLVSPANWARLRSWISHLCCGRGLPLLELPAGSLPNPLSPGDARVPRPLVLHLDGDAPTDLEQRLAGLAAEGWLPLLVHGGASLELPALNTIDGRGHEPVDVSEALLRAGIDPVLPLREFVRRAERRYIQEVIGLHGGIKTRACETLQITRQTLYSKLASME
jgi:hypothetical protein